MLIQLPQLLYHHISVPVIVAFLAEVRQLQMLKLFFEFNVVEVALVPPKVKLPAPPKVAEADIPSASVTEAIPDTAVLFIVIAVEADPLAEAIYIVSICSNCGSVC